MKRRIALTTTYMLLSSQLSKKRKYDPGQSKHRDPQIEQDNMEPSEIRKTNKYEISISVKRKHVTWFPENNLSNWSGLTKSSIYNDYPSKATACPQNDIFSSAKDLSPAKRTLAGGFPDLTRSPIIDCPEVDVHTAAITNKDLIRTLSINASKINILRCASIHWNGYEVSKFLMRYCHSA